MSLKLETPIIPFDAARYKRRTLKGISHLVIHRTIGDTAQEMVEEFRKTEKYQAGWYTKGKIPYHYFIDDKGCVTRTLPITCIGPAAGKLNDVGIQVALAGDLRKKRPSEAQYEALVQVCGAHQIANGNQLEIVGHTELKGTTSDKNKECPGRFLDTDALRNDVYLCVAKLRKK